MLMQGLCGGQWNAVVAVLYPGPEMLASSRVVTVLAPGSWHWGKGQKHVGP